MTDADYEDDLALLANIPTQAELNVNIDKTEFMSFEKDGAMSSLSTKSLRLLDQLTEFGGIISSIESNVIIG